MSLMQFTSEKVGFKSRSGFSRKRLAMTKHKSESIPMLESRSSFFSSLKAIPDSSAIIASALSGIDELTSSSMFFLQGQTKEPAPGHRRTL